MLSNSLVFSLQEKEADPFCDDDPDEHGTVIGAARLGDKAAIGNGLWTTAHGGAVSFFSLLLAKDQRSLLECGFLVLLLTQILLHEQLA